MIIRGKIEHFDGVTNLVADRLEPLSSVFPEAGDILPSGTAPATPLTFRTRLETQLRGASTGNPQGVPRSATVQLRTLEGLPSTGDGPC